MDTKELIIESLSKAFAPEHIEVVDESHKHRSHAGAGGGGHFYLYLVSDRFEGLKAVARQRLVYQELAELMGGAIHALSMQTLTRAEARPPQAK